MNVIQLANHRALVPAVPMAQTAPNVRFYVPSLTFLCLQQMTMHLQHGGRGVGDGIELPLLGCGENFVDLLSSLGRNIVQAFGLLDAQVQIVGQGQYRGRIGGMHDHGHHHAALLLHG